MKNYNGILVAGGRYARSQGFLPLESTQIWIGTSWKMNKTLADAVAFATALARDDWPHDASIQRFVVPPFTAVREVKQILAHTSVRVGAQNMHWADDGAWTGEISPAMLTDCSLDMVELGHSERRAHFGETDDTVSLKVDAAVRHGLIPLVCVGETREQRDGGAALRVLENQVRQALGRLTNTQATVLIAYEPVWAIGANGTPASASYANDCQEHIQRIAQDVLGRSVPCLYGGSVTADNCVEFVCQAHIDGLFIGRAAWDVHGYIDILSRCASAIVGR